MAAPPATVASLPAVIMRGGTSKGVFLHESDLPPAGPERDRLLLNIMGSPDPMQIDGLGGTHSSTSKVVVVGPGREPGIDVSYWFAQIGVDSDVVDWSGNCGNLTTAVGPFAIDERLVEPKEPRTRMQLRNENTGVTIRATVEVVGGRAAVAGELQVAGVPSPGSPVAMEYLDPAGGVLGRALPTGHPADEVLGHTASILDVTHPSAFVDAEALGLRLADVTPDGLNRDPEILERFERIRGECAVAVGAVASWREARERASIVPRLVLVEPPEPGDDEADVRALALAMGRVHHALPMTVALCLAAAAAMPGTVVAGAARPAKDGALRIRHAKGLVTVTADVDADGRVASVGLVRTARRLMAGTIYVRPS